MKKITSINFNKNRTRKTKWWLGMLSICMMFFIGQQGFAQQYYPVAGTCVATVASNTYGPMHSTTNPDATSRTAVIYPASQLTGITGGELISIYFDRIGTTTTDPGGTPNFKLYLKETADIDFGAGALDWATVVSGATLVYDDNPNAAISGGLGQKQIMFSNNYVYSGTNNLIVLMEYVNTGNTTNVQWVYEYNSPCVDTGNNNTTKYTNNTTGTLGTSLSSSNYRRPQIGFDFIVDCPTPSDVMITSNTSTSVTFEWTPGGTETSWDYALQSPGTGTPVIFTNTSSNPLNLAVTPQTMYEFYVRANCGGGDGESAWVGPYTFQSACTIQLSGTYTIGATGDFATFTDAVDELNSCGVSGPVTFNVLTGSGPYNEQVIINEIFGASAVNTVTFNGNGETMTSTTTASDRSLILLDGADYVIIENLNLVTQSDINNFAIQLTNNADFNTINNCVFDLTSTINSTSATNAGIVVAGSLTSYTVTTGDSGTNNTFTNNIITGGHAGIAVSGASSISSNNIVENNIINDNYSYGAYFRSVSSSSISNNSMSRPVRDNTTTYSGLYFITAGENNMIESNRIFNTHGGMTGNSSATYPIYHTGVDATPGNENKVINNLIYDVNNNGTLYGIYNSSSDGVYYYHNTISLDDPNATGGNTRGIYQTTAATGIEFKNNIITITRGGTGTKHALYFNTDTSVIASDNNVLYVNPPAGTVNIGHLGSTGYATLSDWQTATSGDLNSVDVEPIYANSLGGDFTPSNPGVNNIGAALGVLNDIDGNPRSATTPDPGAYEFTPPACPQPSEMIATNITGTTADLGWTENGTSTIWDIEWGLSGFTPTAVPNITGTSLNPHPLTGLTELTDYDFYVRSNCGGGDLSVWVGPFTFTTGCLAPLAGSYTIDAGGTGDYLSLNEAVSSLITCGVSAPVTFNVVAGSGPYDEQIIIPEIVGASAVNTITFNGNGETLTAMTTTSDRYLILLDGADYVTITDFNLVTQADTNNFVIQLTNNADFNTVDNCVIDLSSAMSSTSATNGGIVVSGSLTSYTLTSGDTGTNNTFINNTITGGHVGIAISGGSSISMDNIVENNIVNDNYSFGIYFRSVSNSSASHNSISRPVRGNTTTYSGLYFITAGENNMIASNRIFNTHGGITGNSSATYPIYHTGVDATSGNENWVVNNLIYDVKNNGSLYGIYNSSSDGVYYYHNTISLDDSDATGGLTRGVYQLTTASNIEIKNNIISITRGGTGTKYALYFGTTASTIVSDNNVLYVNAPAGTNGVGYYSTGYPTLADWQTTANGGIYDNASVDGNPIYANILGGDLSPTNPAVNDIGTPVGVLEDIDGALRSLTTPDAGAYEFTPPSCVQPSNLNAINITENSADLSWTENGTATLWDIEWDEAGFTPTGTPTIAGVTTNPYPLSGLNGSTKYEFYVRSDCGGGDTSNWSGPYQFSTLCPAVIVAPWSEDFDNGGLIPTCWSQGASNSEDWIFSTTAQYIGDAGDLSGTSTESGGYFAYVDDSTPNSLGTTIETNFIDVSGLSVPMLSFYYISYSNNFANVDFTVQVYDGSTWNNVHFSNSDTNGWEKIIVDLSTLTITGNIQLRFIIDEVGTGGSDFYDDLAIDDVSIYEGLVCPDPSTLTASNNTTSSADLGWTENGTATSWDIEYGLSGFTPTGTPTNAGVTTNPYNLTGLTHNTMYEFYVRADCGGGDLSGWAGPLLFETLEIVCDAPTALTEVDVTDTTVEVSWTASASETGGYEWFVFEDGDDPLTDPSLFNGTVATGITTVTITGLDPETDYDFYVSTLCDQNVESSLAGPLNVLTEPTPIPAPLNDECTDAIMLAVGIDFPDEQVVGTNEGATNDPGDAIPTCDNTNFAANGKDVWYTVVVPASGLVTVETRTNGDADMTDTGLQIYSGLCGAIASIECNADDGDGNFSKIELSGQTPGQTLLIRVWGWNLNEGEFLISAYDDFDPTAFPAPYCGPIDFTQDVEPITNVVVAGISNTSSNVVNGSPAHEDFTLVIGTMEQGEMYSITLEGNTNGNFTNHFTVFIDWNQNDVLDDAGEVYPIGSIINSTGIDGQQATGTITVPAGADLGQTRMRVFKNYNVSVTDPCLDRSYGQVEDYTINIIPVAITCDIPTNIVLEGIGPDSAEFSWTASATETNGYEWAVFNPGDDPLVDPAVTFGTVPTGVTTVLVTGLDEETTYDFYVRTDCDPNGMSDWEGPLTFTTDFGAGINDFDLNSIAFYPNPMVDVVNITAQVEIEKVEIFSLIGQKLIELKVGSTATQINVSNFASGPYLLYVTTSTGKVGVYNLIKK